MLSNGPGDPKEITEDIEIIKGVLRKSPLFRYLLRTSVSGLSMWCRYRKIEIWSPRFKPSCVKNLETNRVEITSQNHGYTVKMDSLEGTDLSITHLALNDGTVEGLKHKHYPAFTVQYHPEASPGPVDPNYLFDQFIELMQKQNSSVS